MSLKTVLQDTFLKSRNADNLHLISKSRLFATLAITILEAFSPSGQFRHLSPQGQPYVKMPAYLTQLIALTFLGIAPENVTKKNNWTNMSWPKKIAAGFFALFLPLRVIGAVFTNLIRIVTEVIPRFFSEWIGYGIEACINEYNQQSGLAKGLGATGAVLLTALRVPFLLCHWVGRAFSSPVVSARAAYATGREIGGNGPVGKVLGVVFAATSAAVTAVTWLVLAPLAAKLIIAKVVTHIPVLSTAATWFAKTSVGTWLAKTFGLSASSTNVLAHGARALITNGAAVGVAMGGSYGVVAAKLPVDAARNHKSQSLSLQLVAGFKISQTGRTFFF